MKYKDRVKKDFDLNIDSQKEFEKFNNKIELVDDSVSLVNKFIKFKKSMILTCSVLGAILVGSIGVNVVGVILDGRDKHDDWIVLLNKSVDAANKHFEIISNTNLQHTELTFFINDRIVFNVYEINSSYFGQVFQKNIINDYNLCYSIDDINEFITLSKTNVIWEFGYIKDKLVDITFYKNDLIVDTFSFKL